MVYIAHIREDGTVQTLEEHLNGTAKLAKQFAEKIGLASFGELCGLLHDVGKYSRAFQEYIKPSDGKNETVDPDAEPDTEGGKVADWRKGPDHSSAGAQTVWDKLNDGNPTVRQLVGQIIALSIASHHSGLIDCIKPDGTARFDDRIKKEPKKTHKEEANINIDESVRQRIGELVSSDCFEKEFLALMEKATTQILPQEILDFTLGLVVRFVFSALLDADRLNSAEREPRVKQDWQPLIDLLEKKVNAFETENKVDEIRKKISSACFAFAERGTGLYQLTVPTGGGKTLASLRFALSHAKKHGMDRIVYVVPYTTIIDQNASDVREIFQSLETAEHPIVLEHHSNLTPTRDTWQTKVLSENWDAPIVFTTAVQLLDTLFASGTRGARRFHQLVKAVIVFDEIQTLPIKTTHLFNNTMNFLVGACESSVVFCTATQPLLDKVDKTKGAAKITANGQMMDGVESLFHDLRRVQVLDETRQGGWASNEIMEMVNRELSITGSTLVIVNLKKQARELYHLCKGIPVPVYHLSTGMCPAHRKKVLRQVQNHLDRKEPVICISTQLIEAGVNIDFGSVIRYMAGLDSIAQAAGRCNRHGKRSQGRVILLNPRNENLDKLPDIRIAKEKAERVLDEYKKAPEQFQNDLLSPSAMERFYQYYFFDRAHEMDYPVTRKQLDREDTLLSLLSTNHLSVEAHKRSFKKAPVFPLRQSFMSAAMAFEVIDTASEGIIVPYDENGKRIIAELSATPSLEKRANLLKQAQQYSVNLYPHEKSRLQESDALHETQKESGVLYLDERYYSKEFGLSLDSVGDMEPIIFDGEMHEKQH